MIAVLSNSGLAIFLVVFWVFGLGKKFDKMNNTLERIEQYFINFIKQNGDKK
jgi:hypothetical protein